MASLVSQIPPWSYEGDSAPDYWPSLSTRYHTCGDGQQQSPIDLDPTLDVTTTTASIKFSYRPIAIDLFNSGRTVQQTGDENCTLTIDNQIYQLLQFHIHTPSEHTQGGMRYPMELHFVHRHIETNQLAVVGVWLEPGAARPELDILAQYLPQQPGEQRGDAVQLNPANLLPENRQLIRYSGSLTTPPCAEGVTWLVMTTPIEASAQQIRRFHQLLGNNARPLQR